MEGNDAAQREHSPRDDSDRDPSQRDDDNPEAEIGGYEPDEGSSWPRRKARGEDVFGGDPGLMRELEDRAKAFFLEKSSPSRDPQPPRDFITGMPAEWGDIMALKPGTGESDGERDAVAYQLRHKEEKSAWEKREELKRETEDGARGASTRERDEPRRDVTGTFLEGRSRIGSNTDGYSDDRRDQPSGAGQETQRDVTGKFYEGRSMIGRDVDAWWDDRRDITGSREAIESSSFWESKRWDITGRETHDGMVAISPDLAERRDVTGLLTVIAGRGQNPSDEPQRRDVTVRLAA